MRKFGKGYNVKIGVMVLSLLLMLNGMLHSHEITCLRKPLSSVYDEGRLRDGKDIIALGGDVLREYLEKENLLFPMLLPEAQESVINQIELLGNMDLLMPQGEKQGIAEYIKHELLRWGLSEDSLERIIVYDDLFLPDPDFLNIVIKLSVTSAEEIKKCDKFRVKIKGALSEITADADSFPVRGIDWEILDGEFNDTYASHQEYLASLYLSSGIIIYGELISRDDLNDSTFRLQAKREIKKMISIMEKRSEKIGFDSSRILIELLHAAAIIENMNPWFLKEIDISFIYPFISNFYSPNVKNDGRQRQALIRTDDFLDKHNANSIYAHFFVYQLIHMAKKSNEQALEKLKKFAKLGNPEAIAFVEKWESSLVTRIRMRLEFTSILIKDYLVKEYSKMFDGIEEIKELTSAVELLEININKWSDVDRQFRPELFSFIRQLNRIYPAILKSGLSIKEGLKRFGEGVEALDLFEYILPMGDIVFAPDGYAVLFLGESGEEKTPLAVRMVQSFKFQSGNNDGIRILSFSKRLFAGPSSIPVKIINMKDGETVKVTNPALRIDEVRTVVIVKQSPDIDVPDVKTTCMTSDYVDQLYPFSEMSEELKNVIGLGRIQYITVFLPSDPGPEIFDEAAAKIHQEISKQVNYLKKFLEEVLNQGTGHDL